jgi:hypothetical protein
VLRTVREKWPPSANAREATREGAAVKEKKTKRAWKSSKSLKENRSVEAAHRKHVQWAEQLATRSFAKPIVEDHLLLNCNDLAIFSVYPPGIMLWWSISISPFGRSNREGFTR